MLSSDLLRLKAKLAQPYDVATEDDPEMDEYCDKLIARFEGLPQFDVVVPTGRIGGDMVTNNLLAFRAMVAALNLLRNYKAGVEPDKARFYAVALTEQEKAVAYFRTFVLTEAELIEEDSENG